MGDVRVSSGFQSVPVPFVKIGNRRALTDKQLCEDPELKALVDRFPKSFEYDPELCVSFFVELV
jgi:hypothetical protein